MASAGGDKGSQPSLFNPCHLCGHYIRANRLSDHMAIAHKVTSLPRRRGRGRPRKEPTVAALLGKAKAESPVSHGSTSYLSYANKGRPLAIASTGSSAHRDQIPGTAQNSAASSGSVVPCIETTVQTQPVQNNLMLQSMGGTNQGSTANNVVLPAGFVLLNGSATNAATVSCLPLGTNAILNPGNSGGTTIGLPVVQGAISSPCISGGTTGNLPGGQGAVPSSGNSGATSLNMPLAQGANPGLGNSVNQGNFTILSLPTTPSVPLVKSPVDQSTNALQGIKIMNPGMQANSVAQTNVIQASPASAEPSLTTLSPATQVKSAQPSDLFLKGATLTYKIDPSMAGNVILPETIGHHLSSLPCENPEAAKSAVSSLPPAPSLPVQPQVVQGLPIPSNGDILKAIFTNQGQPGDSGPPNFSLAYSTGGFQMTTVQSTNLVQGLTIANPTLPMNNLTVPGIANVIQGAPVSVPSTPGIVTPATIVQANPVQLRGSEANPVQLSGSVLQGISGPNLAANNIVLSGIPSMVQSSSTSSIVSSTFVVSTSTIKAGPATMTGTQSLAQTSVPPTPAEPSNIVPGVTGCSTQTQAFKASHSANNKSVSSSIQSLHTLNHVPPNPACTSSNAVTLITRNQIPQVTPRSICNTALSSKQDHTPSHISDQIPLVTPKSTCKSVVSPEQNPTPSQISVQIPHGIPRSTCKTVVSSEENPTPSLISNQIPQVTPRNACKTVVSPKQNTWTTVVSYKQNPTPSEIIVKIPHCIPWSTCKTAVSSEQNPTPSQRQEIPDPKPISPSDTNKLSEAEIDNSIQNAIKEMQRILDGSYVKEEEAKKQEKAERNAETAKVDPGKSSRPKGLVPILPRPTLATQNMENRIQVPKVVVPKVAISRSYTYTGMNSEPVNEKGQENPNNATRTCTQTSSVVAAHTISIPSSQPVNVKGWEKSCVQEATNIGEITQQSSVVAAPTIPSLQPVNEKGQDKLQCVPKRRHSGEICRPSGVAPRHTTTSSNSQHVIESQHKTSCIGTSTCTGESAESTNIVLGHTIDGPYSQPLRKKSREGSFSEESPCTARDAQPPNVVLGHTVAISSTQPVNEKGQKGPYTAGERQTGVGNQPSSVRLGHSATSPNSQHVIEREQEKPCIRISMSASTGKVTHPSNVVNSVPMSEPQPNVLKITLARGIEKDWHVVKQHQTVPSQPHVPHEETSQETLHPTPTPSEIVSDSFMTILPDDIKEEEEEEKEDETTDDVIFVGSTCKRNSQMRSRDFYQPSKVENSLEAGSESNQKGASAVSERKMKEKLLQNTLDSIFALLSGNMADQEKDNVDSPIVHDGRSADLNTEAFSVKEDGVSECDVLSIKSEDEDVIATDDESYFADSDLDIKTESSPMKNP